MNGVGEMATVKRSPYSGLSWPGSASWVFVLFVPSWSRYKREGPNGKDGATSYF
jgi:hypothetical protein